MSKHVSLSLLSRFWTKAKNYIDTGLSGKSDTTHGHSYNDLSDKPTIPAAYTHPSNHPASMITGLATVATSGSYNDLSDTPAAYTHPASHPAGMITGLADVATSGSYNDLADKPTIPSAYTHPANHPASMITGLATVATSGSYADLSNKPTIPTTVAQLTDAANYALKTDLTNVYKYKGSVATQSALPTSGNTVGDVYNVEADGMNWAWNGTAWDNLGTVFTVEFATEAEIDALFE